MSQRKASGSINHASLLIVTPAIAGEDGPKKDLPIERERDTPVTAFLDASKNVSKLPEEASGSQRTTRPVGARHDCGPNDQASSRS